MNLSKLPISLGLMACTLLSSPDAFSWGHMGHQITGELAQRHLTPVAKKKIFALMSDENSQSIQDQNHLIAKISTWADEIRSDHSMDKYKPWHFIDIPDGMTYGNSERSPKGDTISAIRELEEKLKSSSTSKKDKMIALKFLVHLVQDLHQPLHVGRKEDRGGNTIRVSFFGRQMNLHQVWDSRLIERDTRDYLVFTDKIDSATSDELNQWQTSGYEDWAQEDVDLRAGVYELNLDSGTTLKTQDFMANFREPPFGSFNTYNSEVHTQDAHFNDHDYRNNQDTYRNHNGHHDRNDSRNGHRCGYEAQGESTMARRRTPLPVLAELYQNRNFPIAKERLRMAGFRLAAILNSIFQ